MTAPRIPPSALNVGETDLQVSGFFLHSICFKILSTIELVEIVLLFIYYFLGQLTVLQFQVRFIFMYSFFRKSYAVYYSSKSSRTSCSFCPCKLFLLYPGWLVDQWSFRDGTLLNLMDCFIGLREGFV